MKTMTLSIFAALALGCASKPVEDLPTDDLSETDGDGGTTADDDDDDDDDNDDDDDEDNVDEDGDGITVAEGDCNDDDEDVYPGAEEECNGIDDDCDDRIDEGFDTTKYYEDFDEDGYGNPEVEVEACEQPEDYVENEDDCDDTDDDINPEGEEISYNGVDENCDGFDFTGEECVEDALDLTMDWIDYWDFELPNTSGSEPIVGFGPMTMEMDYALSDKVLSVDSKSTTAVGRDDDPLVVEVAIEADITIYAHFVADMALTITPQNCTMEIGPAPVLFTGTVEFDEDDLGTGDEVTGSVDLTPTVLEFTDYEAELHPDAGEGDACSISTIDTILGYLGYSIDGFVADDLAEVAEELNSKIENDLEEFDIPEACTPE